MRPRVPAFPLACAVEPLREYVAAVAEAMQVPVDLVATLVLSVGATAIANKFEVALSQDWRERRTSSSVHSASR